MTVPVNQAKLSSRPWGISPSVDWSVRAGLSSKPVAFSNAAWRFFCAAFNAPSFGLSPICGGGKRAPSELLNPSRLRSRAYTRGVYINLGEVIDKKCGETAYEHRESDGRAAPIRRKTLSPPLVEEAGAFFTKWPWGWKPPDTLVVQQSFPMEGCGDPVKCRYCHEGSLTEKQAAPITRSSLQGAAPTGTEL